MAAEKKVRSPRAKHRRYVLAELRRIKEQLGFRVTDWDCGATVWIDLADRDPGSPHESLRPRRLEEYPEMSAQEWRRLFDRLGENVAALQELRNYAAGQYNELRQEGNR